MEGAAASPRCRWGELKAMNNKGKLTVACHRADRGGLTFIPMCSS